MKEKYIPGQLRVREANYGWTAEQWSGDHWVFLQLRETREALNKWLDTDWERYPVDRSATD